jgi:mono/diheme cytochrome c family protein
MQFRSLLASCAVTVLLPAVGIGAAVAADEPSAQRKKQTPLYTVVDGYKVDPHTLEGFHTWRAAACDRCHGANQQGLVGPSLIDALKTLTPEQFKETVTNGRLEKGMPSFKTSPTVMSHLEELYDYLKGRSEGAITRAHVELMQ